MILGVAEWAGPAGDQVGGVGVNGVLVTDTRKKSDFKSIPLSKF